MKGLAYFLFFVVAIHIFAMAKHINILVVSPSTNRHIPSPSQNKLIIRCFISYPLSTCWVIYLVVHTPLM